MSLERLQREQDWQSKRQEILTEAQKRQKNLESHFWSQVFPLVERRVQAALKDRGIECTWHVGKHHDYDWHVLTLTNVGQVLYVGAFNYWVSYNPQGFLRLEYKCYDSFARDKDSISPEPPSISLKVLVSERHLPIAFTTDARAVAYHRGDYRFRWYDEGDTERILASLLAILDGKKPESDFKLSACFIATSVYGPWSIETEILRTFRDRYLLRNAVGRLVAFTYYSVSPLIAKKIGHYPLLRNLFRFVLRPLVGFAGYITRERRLPLR